jgi:Mrp family chromosome partitioning ATPase
MDKAGLVRAAPQLDVLVVDDIMRLFSAPDIATAQHAGVHVIGVLDQASGMGQEYLARLGADQLVPATAAPAELVDLILQVGPREQLRPAVLDGATWEPGNPKREHGLLMAWTKVSGGAGLSEALTAAAEQLARRARVLVIEADEVAPVLASRLLRSTESGLAWALSRAAQNQHVLPEGLSGPRNDGTVPNGHFDVICAAPGAAQVLNPVHLLKLVDEALSTYSFVLVEASWLVGSPATRERFAAARAVLARAGAVVVLAASDPDGAAKLVEWRANALMAGVKAPCWAALGRASKSRYERAHLKSLVEVNTGRYPFAGITFLPEDPTVARARWNAEMVWKGPWLKAVRALVVQASGSQKQAAGTADAGQGHGGAGGRANGSGNPTSSRGHPGPGVTWTNARLLGVARAHSPQDGSAAIASERDSPAKAPVT